MLLAVLTHVGSIGYAREGVGTGHGSADTRLRLQSNEKACSQILFAPILLVVALVF